MEIFKNIRNSQRFAKWDIRPIDVALFICLVLTFGYALTGLLARACEILSGEELPMNSLSFLIVSGFGLQLGCLAAWLAFSVISPTENENQPDSFWRAVKIGVLGFIAAYLAIIPTMMVWRIVLDTLNFEYELQLPVQLVQNGGSNIEMALMTLLVVVVAPISEELVYRGFLFRYLNNRAPLGLAIIITAILFAAIHQNLYSFAPLAILGAALCVVYRLSGNIVSSITMHACFNLLNLVLMVYFTPIEA